MDALITGHASVIAKVIDGDPARSFPKRALTSRPYTPDCSPLIQLTLNRYSLDSFRRACAFVCVEVVTPSNAKDCEMHRFAFRFFCCPHRSRDAH